MNEEGFVDLAVGLVILNEVAKVIGNPKKKKKRGVFDL
jgi:hypothetical protein